MRILVINTGSSSLKYQLFDMENEEILAKGMCERIGIDGHLRHQPLVGGKAEFDEDIALANHSVSMQAVLEKLTNEENGVVSDISEIDAVGHRVVHAGEVFSGSVRITDEVIAALEDCIPLAPLHNPANIVGISACREIMGDIPMVGVFDTAFHQTMPKKAFVFPIPYEYYRSNKVRRYAFHGTSHRYVSGCAADMLKTPIRDLKLISCHLGNGSSVCAIDGGKSVDSSMGMTPLAGLPMGTRSGDIETGVLQYIMTQTGIDMDEMMDVLNKKSGVLGVSELSSDFRDLEAAAADGHAHAQLALDIFCYDVAKYIGSYAAAMNGVDGIIFTAGIGENNAAARERICNYLQFLGCEFDSEANKQRGCEFFISTPDSKVKIMVIPTNEELVIARDTKQIVG